MNILALSQFCFLLLPASLVTASIASNVKSKVSPSIGVTDRRHWSDIGRSHCCHYWSGYVSLSSPVEYFKFILQETSHEFTKFPWALEESINPSQGWKQLFVSWLKHLLSIVLSGTINGVKDLIVIWMTWFPWDAFQQLSQESLKYIRGHATNIIHIEYNGYNLLLWSFP